MQAYETHSVFCALSSMQRYHDKISDQVIRYRGWCGDDGSS